jgi:hypothetical protein
VEISLSGVCTELLAVSVCCGAKWGEGEVALSGMFGIVGDIP